MIGAFDDAVSVLRGGREVEITPTLLGALGASFSGTLHTLRMTRKKEENTTTQNVTANIMAGTMSRLCINGTFMTNE
jgi:hypothetical protein